MIRVSGPSAWDSARALSTLPLVARQAGLHHVKDPSSRETIDKALVLPFKAPASFTGEDIVEYHVHGGRAVVDSLLNALAQQPNHRLAEPGEFTRRAFENGKMDLTEAEAVADLIDAETQAQKIQALAQMDGGLSTLYEGWTEKLKEILAHAEADLEFPDEDLPDGIFPQLVPQIKTLLRDIDEHLNDNRRGERLRDGIRVAVIGAPNTGKSTLVNALAQRDVAIVSDIPGTTRDVLDVHLDIGGYPVILSDTAGLRPDQIGNEGHEGIESEGIRRALKKAQEADIKLLVFDAAEDRPDPHTLALLDEHCLCVVNKADKQNASEDMEGIKISAQTGAGLNTLIDTLLERLHTLIGMRETPSLTRKRHRTALENTRESLHRSLSAALPELAAEDLRLAIRHLGRITGRVDVEDLLDVIFQDFCIGK